MGGVVTVVELDEDDDDCAKPTLGTSMSAVAAASKFFNMIHSP